MVIGIIRHIIPSHKATTSTKVLGALVTIGASALKVALDMRILSLISITFLTSLSIVGIARHKCLFWTSSQKKRDEALFFVGRCPQTHTSVFHSILGLFMSIERSESGTNRSTATADVL